MSAFENPKDRWNQRFDTPLFVFGEHANAYLVAKQHLLPSGHLLAVADGEGRNSVHLARAGWRVDAFDFSDVAIAKARQHAVHHGVEVAFTCTDCAQFDWGINRYDGVVGIFFQFADPAERAAIFKQIDTCLKPGGVVLIQGYGTGQLRFNTGGPGRLEHLYTEDLLVSAFEGYEVLDRCTYEAELAEGAGHAGRSALVGFVARKP